MGRKSLAVVFGISGIVLFLILRWFSEQYGVYVYLYPWANTAEQIIFWPAAGVAQGGMYAVAMIAQGLRLGQYTVGEGAVDILLTFGTMFLLFFLTIFLQFAIPGYFLGRWLENRKAGKQ